MRRATGPPGPRRRGRSSIRRAARAARARARKRRRSSLEPPHPARARGLPELLAEPAPQGGIASGTPAFHNPKARISRAPSHPCPEQRRGVRASDGFRAGLRRPGPRARGARAGHRVGVSPTLRPLRRADRPRDESRAARSLRGRARGARGSAGDRTPGGQAAGPAHAADEGPGARAWAVLGLAVGASPLEVASAYVSLCEELDRELAAAPTEALRHRCLEARAEIDSAYQHCAAAPLAAETAGATNAAAGYETQVARATFEAPVAEPASPDPGLVRILADPDPPPPARARRARRRPLRPLAPLLLVAAAGALGYVWWSDPERLHVLTRYLPLPPTRSWSRRRPVPSICGAACRRAARHPTPRRRGRRAGRTVSGGGRRRGRGAPDSHTRADGTLEQVQARSALAKHLSELTERHIFSSSALAQAFGRMEQATELANSGETERAVTAYGEARANLEAVLANLDEAESALGARYEAVDARDAWLALAASAGLEPGDAVLEGGERLARPTACSRRATSRRRSPSCARPPRAFAPRSTTGGASSRRRARRSKPSARPSRRNNSRARSPRRGARR